MHKAPMFMRLGVEGEGVSNFKLGSVWRPGLGIYSAYTRWKNRVGAGVGLDPSSAVSTMCGPLRCTTPSSRATGVCLPLSRSSFSGRCRLYASEDLGGDCRLCNRGDYEKVTHNRGEPLRYFPSTECEHVCESDSGRTIYKRHTSNTAITNF